MLSIEILVPLTIGLVEVVKRVGVVGIKYVPFVSVVVGVALSFLNSGMTGESVMTGVIVGLISCGLFDTIKSGARVAGIFKQSIIKRVAGIFKQSIIK